MAQEGSLASKLMNLRTGETIYLEDREYPSGPTLMERSVQTLVHRVPPLIPRKFSTSRWVAIQTGPLKTRVLLAITRDF